MKRARRFRRAVVAAPICLLVMVGCGRKHRASRTPPAPAPAAAPAPATTASRRPSVVPPRPAVPNGYAEEGIASWYGIPFHGRAAADGEIYDMETLVAAHRLMPFNTWLKVTNLANDKSVNVRVIDRGPFVEGRIIDLSKAAARAIDLLGPGTGRVRLEVIAAPADIPANDFYAVQVGAFSVYANAERARSAYAQRFAVAQLALRQGKVPMWRVLVGKEPSIQAAQQLANTLTAENKDVFIVRLDETVINPATPPPSQAVSPMPAEDQAQPNPPPSSESSPEEPPPSAPPSSAPSSPPR